MNELKVFQNTELSELGVLIIIDKEYFPVTECAKLLGYKDTINAIKQHCRWVVKHHLPRHRTQAKSQDEFHPRSCLVPLHYFERAFPPE